MRAGDQQLSEDAGIGVTLQQFGRDAPIFISTITPGGPVDNTGQIRVGDQLSSVDDMPVNIAEAGELKRSPPSYDL
ncbi:hypothetical protein T484DRAFT_1778930 [Baffinella frigidus]|nr:hypothetical protein T484DRAFT_1778930 [Cryptophyta sp. CCMP2293]